MEKEAVKVAEETVETVATNGSNELIIFGAGVAVGTGLTLGVIKAKKYFADRKAKKTANAEEVEVEE